MPLKFAQPIQNVTPTKILKINDLVDDDEDQEISVKSMLPDEMPVSERKRR